MDCFDVVVSRVVLYVLVVVVVLLTSLAYHSTTVLPRPNVTTEH